MLTPALMSSLHLKGTFHFSLTCSDTASGKAGENISYTQVGEFFSLLEFLTCGSEALPAQSPAGLGVALPLCEAAAPWIPHCDPTGKPRAHWQEPWALAGAKSGSMAPQEWQRAGEGSGKGCWGNIP